MKLKTYTAANMSTALAMVKRDLGTDAVILHTRKYRKRTFFGLGGHDVVEITASDGADMNQRRERVRRRVEPIATTMPEIGLRSRGAGVGGAGVGGGVGVGSAGHGMNAGGNGNGMGGRSGAGGNVGGGGNGGGHESQAAPSTQELIRRTYAAAMAQVEQQQPSAGGRAGRASASHEHEGLGMTGRANGAGGAGGMNGMARGHNDSLLSSLASAGMSAGVTTIPTVPTVPAVVESQAVAMKEQRAGGLAGGSNGMPMVTQSIHAGNEQLADEMRAVKRMVSQMMQKQDDSGPRDVPDELFDQYLALLEQEVAQELATEVVMEVRQELSEDDLRNADKVREALRVALSGLIPTDPNAGKWPEKNPGRPVGPRKIALIGPTGVGKTTTIAKLAANLKLKEGKSVAMITLDTYRIAAVDQLRTYANIIGVPLHVVMSPGELEDALARCADRDAVLIDTAGRSQRDDPRLDQLHGFLESADPDEVHLVLSSTGSQKVLMQIVERFSRTRIDRIIFTKLDEAVSFGVLLNVARKVNKALSYVTMGQEVPHHIEAGTSDRLAALLLGEEI